jgi:integrase
MANIIPRGNGYFIMVSGGYDLTGKQIRHTVTWKPAPGMTERQKQKALNAFVVDFEARVKQGRSTDGSITFEEFSRRYMEQYVVPQLAPKTIARYKDLFKRINPAIGHLKMEKIQIQHLAELYGQLGEAKNHQGISFLATSEFFEAVEKKQLTREAIAKKSGTAINTVYQVFNKKAVARVSAEKIALAAGSSFHRAFVNSRAGKVLSNKTIRHHHMLISAVLNKAVEWEVIKENKARLIKPPKVEKRDVVFLEEAEVEVLIRELKKAPVQEAMMIKLFLLTGMRRGEMCGLEWKDIDFKRKVLSIHRASQYLKDRGVFTKEPKTKSSKRSMPIARTTSALLKNYKEWQEKQRAFYGDEWNESDRLFTTANGAPIHPDTVSGWFHDFIKRTGLPEVSVHGLRHTFITLMISKGIDIVTVSNLVGHSMPSTTINMYAHAVSERKASAVEAIGQVYDGLM